MNEKIKYVCSSCGSENVKFDAWAVWNSETQQMELDNTFDNTWCDTCKGECSVKEVEI